MAGNSRYIVGFVAGIVVGVVAVTLINHRGTELWIDAGSQWMVLPSHTRIGPLPQTLTTPARAYDYGATTDALTPAVAEAGPMMLKVQLGAVTGNVGLSLDKPDGSALVSREHALNARDSGSVAYFHLSGSQGPVALLVRNYADQGHTGSVEVKSATYISEARLDAKAMSAINKAGVY
jgi:hypothetical protein